LRDRSIARRRHRQGDIGRIALVVSPVEEDQCPDDNDGKRDCATDHHHPLALAVALLLEATLRTAARGT
jgi:hypothetical protein